MSFEAVRHRVSFVGASGPLDADLTIPAWLGPHPAVVLMGGRSGPRDRGRWVQTLAWYGLAVLSWDSPGWGSTAGIRHWQAPDERTLELVSAVKFLQTIRDVSPERIAVIGSDTGCWAAALGAALSSQIAAVALLAAPCGGAPAQEVTRLGQRLHARGFAPEEVALAQLILAERIRRLSQGEDPGAVLAAEGPCRTAGWYSWLPGHSASELTAFATLADYHPPTLLGSVRCPVLGVYGEDDPATPAWPNAQLLHDALATSPGRDHQVLVLPRTDDAFAPQPTTWPDPAATESGSALPPAGSWTMVRMPGDWHRDLAGAVSDWLSSRLGPYRPSSSTPTPLPRAG
ncbi:MAG TPA: alpha/beta hydrolase [Kineosporiaceae bacterium]